MKAATIRKKLIDEITKIPDEKLPEIYDFLYYFRLGLVTKSSNPQKTLQLAGSWNDMSEEDFDDFLNDIQIRRKTAFTSRREREASIS
jgi:hypothetical protein